MYDLSLRHAMTVKKMGFFLKGCSCIVEDRQQFVEQRKYYIWLMLAFVNDGPYFNKIGLA